ncbi:MAG: hypothetical protein WBD87_16650 [Candidatus Acidiferrales bacterium]
MWQLTGCGDMLSQSVWWVCIALEALLLARAARANLFKKFPLFYSYIAWVLATDLLSVPIYMHYPSLYSSFYWATEFLMAAISYGVLMEIYHRSLKNYPGVARFFEILLLIMFLVIATKVSVGLFSNSHLSFARAVAELEHDLRQLQAVLLSCLLVLFIYYKIPIGRNLRGLVLGYSLLVGTEVITLTFAFHPTTGFAPLMRRVEPLLYAVSLIIWSLALWASSPEMVTGTSCGIEQDYEHLAQETKMMLLRARTHLARAARP